MLLFVTESTQILPRRGWCRVRDVCAVDFPLDSLGQFCETLISRDARLLERAEGFDGEPEKLQRTGHSDLESSKVANRAKQKNFFFNVTLSLLGPLLASRRGASGNVRVFLWYRL